MAVGRAGVPAKVRVLDVAREAGIEADKKSILFKEVLKITIFLVGAVMCLLVIQFYSFLCAFIVSQSSRKPTFIALSLEKRQFLSVFYPFFFSGRIYSFPNKN